MAKGKRGKRGTRDDSSDEEDPSAAGGDARATDGGGDGEGEPTMSKTEMKRLRKGNKGKNGKEKGNEDARRACRSRERHASIFGR